MKETKGQIHKQRMTGAEKTILCSAVGSARCTAHSYVCFVVQQQQQQQSGPAPHQNDLGSGCFYAAAVAGGFQVVQVYANL
jgi:hypothetical protein